MGIARLCVSICLRAGRLFLLLALAGAACLIIAATSYRNVSPGGRVQNFTSESRRDFEERYPIDMSGFELIDQLVPSWTLTATPQDIGEAWRGSARRAVEKIDRMLAETPNPSVDDKILNLWIKVALLNSEGEPKKAYQVIETIRSIVKNDKELNRNCLFTTIYSQGVTALRLGETENCVMCRGESSCILPISPAAVHANPDGSRLAIRHFMEYLNRFPNDLEVRWLLNIAHMTLGEYPDKVDPRFVLALDHFFGENEFGIGKFHDIGHLVGVNQFTQAGGAVMEDFDNDGLLDIAITSFDPTCQMNLLRNTGTGTFEDLRTGSGLTGQLGGVNCVQADYNNDGLMDIFVIRGAWLPRPMRPSLLRNSKSGAFTDVTEEAGMLDPGNSIAAQWADYDNDGWLDLFVCCERQHSRLYRNLGNGAFEEVAAKAGLTINPRNTKGAAWIDYDNDGFPDLFQTHYSDDAARLFHNNRDGTFEEVTSTQGIDGPVQGFSCWTWDYDNDGWQDIFATCYDKSLEDVVKGLMGQPHGRYSNRLYRNMHGKGFEDVTKEAGLDIVLATMGSNFGDFDNDGFLDMYLGTGDPDFSTLVPNRMFRNLAGKRFAEITVSSGTGNLQKGHGVACGDWDRDGNTDIFIEMGGAVNGDKYHNILFQNPGHDNHWLTVKLIGDKTNRAAIGARIKVVTAGTSPQTFYRHVSSGSSFGANPLQQTIGLAKSVRVAVLEIHWPTSGTTQVFRDIAADQAIAITEFADDYEKLNWKTVPVPVNDRSISSVPSDRDSHRDQPESRETRRPFLEPLLSQPTAVR